MINQATYERYATNPAAFRDSLIVDVDGAPRRFRYVQDDWQRDDFAALDPGLMRCVGRSTDDSAKMRAWIERPRGHSKTTDLAITCCYALVFATRPLRGYAYAADRDQAQLLKDAMAAIVRLNPWMGKILSVEAHRVVNIATSHPAQGGTLTIEASDVGSSYGILPDLIIADEITHWQGDDSLLHSILSSAAKRASCLLVGITNAGVISTWQWELREIIRKDEAWHFTSLDGPKASWITPARLAEQQRMLPAVTFERLWCNRWSSGGGDALTREDIELAFDDTLRPLAPKERDFEFCAGVDLGVSRDASAVCILGIRKINPWFKNSEKAKHGQIRLAYMKLWRPEPGSKINLAEIEQTLLDLDRKFKFKSVAYDPWQAEYLSQRLRLSNLPMVELTQTGANLQKIATTVREAFADRRLALFRHPDLYRDILRLRVEERSYGFRLVSNRDNTGHGDAASAFSYALVAAAEIAGKTTKRVTAFDNLTTSGSKSDRMGRDWERRQSAYQSEMEKLAAWTHADESREELLNALRHDFPRSTRFYP